MYVSLIVLAVLWGAATGVLLPRAAYRFSVETGVGWRDSCPAGHPITGPVRGWLGPPGCAECDAVSARPDGTVVLAGGGRRFPYGACFVNALACAALAAATGPRPELAVWLLLTPFAVLLALIDRKVHRLPDQLTLPLAGAAAVLLGVVAPASGSGGSWTTALLGGLALSACYLVLFLINPRGMGFGDVKLALSLGVVLGWYGWPALFAGGFAGFLLGSVYGVGLIVLRRADRKSAIPFGPFMMGGALLGVVLGGLAA
ncbi:prepilin peptidase [Streptomyces sp. NPDC088725]|uniref:prepilin peptidase n=1 Tax=Streptomyces sp. NPDC088725 TaxID=3365873 RepID=UPI0037F33E55